MKKNELHLIEQVDSITPQINKLIFIKDALLDSLEKKDQGLCRILKEIVEELQKIETNLYRGANGKEAA